MMEKKKLNNAYKKVKNWDGGRMVAIRKVARSKRIFDVVTNKWVLRFGSLAVFLSAWEIVGSGFNPMFFSTPPAVAMELYRIVASGELLSQLVITLETMSVGYVIAAVAAVLTGLAMGVSRKVEHVLDQYLSALNVAPLIAFIPILVLWFGFGFWSRVAYIFMFCFFTIAINTYVGVRNTSSSLVEVGRAFGLSERQIFGKILLQASLPFTMAGLRLGMDRAIKGVVTAEMFMAITGLGGMILEADAYYNTARIFAIILVLCGVGVVLSEVIKRLEKRIAPWKQTERIR